MSALKDHCNIPISKRDAQWEAALFEIIKKSKLFLLEETPFQGPDGYSYMNVSSEKGQRVVKEDFFNWCMDSGVGIVLNLQEGRAPDFVFTNGMVWNFVLRGEFVNSHQEYKKDSDKIFIHDIPKGYLPASVRENMDFFLKENKVKKTFISLVSQGDGTAYELLFYFPELQDIQDKEKKSLLEALSWFLPLDYKLGWSLHKEENFQFQPLF